MDYKSAAHAGVLRRKLYLPHLQDAGESSRNNGQPDLAGDVSQRTGEDASRVIGGVLLFCPSADFRAFRVVGQLVGRGLTHKLTHSFHGRF